MPDVTISNNYVTFPNRHADDLLPELRALIVAIDGLRPGRVPEETYGWLTLLAEERISALEKLSEADSRRDPSGGQNGG